MNAPAFAMLWSDKAILLRSVITVLRRPNPIEPRGLLLVLLGLTIRIEPPPVLCPVEPLEYLVRLDDAICLDTSSSSFSTVARPCVFSPYAAAL